MFGWSKKAPGPDFSAVDSREKASELARQGQLVKLLLLPKEFRGLDVPENCVFVPAWVLEKKTSIDRNVIAPLVAEGKLTSYSASPAYQGRSFIPSSLVIEASGESTFSTTIAIWGDPLKTP